MFSICRASRAIKLIGDGAAEWLRGQIAGALPKAGRMNLGYFADSRGRILTEMTIIRQGEDDFWLMTAAVRNGMTLSCCQRVAAMALTLTDITDDWSTLIVTGPTSRDLLAGMTEADLSAGWLTIQDATVAGKLRSCSACRLRVSWAGKSTREMANARSTTRYCERVPRRSACIALNSMRIEKGYRAWKGDLSTDYTLLEGGLERLVKLDKPQDFPGKAALLAEKQQGAKSALSR